VKREVERQGETSPLDAAEVVVETKRGTEKKMCFNLLSSSSERPFRNGLSLPLSPSLFLARALSTAESVAPK